MSSPGIEDDLEIRRVPEVHGRGLEDGGHEAVDGLDLEIGVFVEDPVDGFPGPAGEPVGVERYDRKHLGRLPRVAEMARLEPVQDAGLHLPGGIPGEGDGQDVRQVVPRDRAHALGEQELDEPERQGVRLPGAGRGLEKDELGERQVRGRE